MATETFWTLLKSLRVVIPIIQRDYAQGRTDDRITQIREAFVGALRGALLQPAPGIELDFVYGTVRRETQPNPFTREPDHTLTLLDGQQRLTTLFLLHWYIAKRTGALGDDVRRRLSRFTYDTRISSRQFCEKLLSAEPAFTASKPSKEIRDAPWFYRAWHDDPTIRSMLTMLDAIHANLDPCAHDELWKALTQTDAVRFQFLEMTQFGLSDDLYIKMNARGSVLTDFEQFKAWLEKCSDERQQELGTCVLGEEERQRLDTSWTDLFWSRREFDAEKKKEIEIGPAYLRFFTGMALAAALDTEKQQVRLGDKRVTDLNANAYFPTSFYEEYELFDEAALGECVKVLDQLMDGGADQIDSLLKEAVPLSDKKPSLFSLFVSKENTYEYRLMFHALCRFLLDRPKETPWDDPETGTALRRWMRVVRNLALNVTVNVASFGQGVRAISDLARWGGLRDIYGLLRDDTGGQDTFAGEQMKEERRKARLISPEAGEFDAEWERALHRAEDHGYFRGRIGFLLEFSKKNGESDREAFEKYAAKAIAIFQEPDGSCMGAPHFLLHRALLTKCDFDGNSLMWASSTAENYSLGFNRAEWTSKLLHNDSPPHKAPWVAPLLKNLKDLLDQITVGREREGLEQIVRESPFEPDDWRGCFIRAPKVMDYCAYRIFRFAAPTRIFPFEKTTMAGRHSELRSHAFYFKYFDLLGTELRPLGEVKYWDRPGDENKENNWPSTLLIGNIYKTKICYGTPGDDKNPFTVEFYPVKGGQPADWESILTRDLGFSINNKSQSYLIRLSAGENVLLDHLRALAAVVARHCPNNRPTPAEQETSVPREEGPQSVNPSR